MTRSSSSSKMSPCPTSPVYALTTSNLHYVDGRSDQQAISLEDRLTLIPSRQQGVEVPNWREDKNHYALCVSKAGVPTRRIKLTDPPTDEAAEPTDDASYLKRHNRPEKAEKQRKK